jgi:hypothetical protein
MSNFRSDDHNPEGCPSCRPAVFNPDNGVIDEHMTALAGKIFDAATPETRRAWHRVTCLNSRDLIDVNLAKSMVGALQKAAMH